MYWDINEILPYQRNFNFINGERSIGKSYTTQKWVLNKCLKEHREFVYILRTQKEKQNGGFEKAFEKVIIREFPEYMFSFSSEECRVKYGDNDITIGYCIALTEAVQIKKRSYPNVYYLIFDEYMLEADQSISYVSGWKEPNLFLNIYHTIDREEDRVMCFLLGNNTNFFNPYHLHPAFRIPDVDRGKIWKSENVLFQWAKADKQLQEKKTSSKFLRMIDGSAYGNYAKDGHYADEGAQFIGTLPRSAKPLCNIRSEGEIYCCYLDTDNSKLYFTDKAYPTCKYNYALTKNDLDEAFPYEPASIYMQVIKSCFHKARVLFINPEVRAKLQIALTRI